MLINNSSANAKYNMVLNEKKISPSKTNCNLQWLKGALTPMLLDTETKFCDIECKFTMEANTEDEFWQKFSEFNKDTVESILKFDDINMLYKCYIQGAKEPTRITPYNWEFTCNWIGYKYKNEIVVNIRKELSKTIDVKGNLKTPCILEVTPSVDLIDLKLDGLANDPIIIKNLKQGKKIIIDSKEGTVTEEGKNKFSDTDFWEFPFLMPGTNTITLSKNNCDVTIKYEPRYL
ncbi:phage distal tail protein [Clostridium perfringens]|uniref:phage distal tail protein n=1 Tax=Clostridium perfringens TaxID=1502 RepID=UPI000E1300C0|nr:phage tail domain-containing protein [Clostridium perfringens]SUY30352.1 tail component family protein [Clostridium perfringens]